MATVTEIIQRLGLKQKMQNNKEQPEISDHTKKNIHSYLQTSSTPVHKEEKHEIEMTEKIEKPEKKQPEKSQQVEAVQEKVDKSEKAQNYLNKIREAKTKAEQLLKEYAKKKQ